MRGKSIFFIVLGLATLGPPLASSALPPCTSRAESADEAKPSRLRRILYNSDGTNIWGCCEGITADDVRRHVDEVSGMQVDTFLICASAMVAYFPSKAVEMLGQGRDLPERGGSRLDLIARNLRKLVDDGHDPVGLVIDRAREKDIEVFVTYRMNDVHDTHLPDSHLHSKFWKNHPQWRVGKGTWNNAALDYAVPEVRRHMLARLQEVIDRYGDRMDGLELDWQRFPSYFKRGKAKENISTLTRFVRKVRRMTDAQAQCRGRPLLLSVRVLPTIEKSRAIGLDPVGWAEERLVDFVTVSRFLHNSEGKLAIGEYQKAMPNIRIYGCVEFGQSPGKAAMPKNFRHEARRLWDVGVDGIYLFNFFCYREAHHGRREPPFFLLNELGNPTTIGQ